MVRRLAIVGLVLAVSGPARGGETWRGQVSDVADGDTLTVLRGRTPIKIRLYAVDAPERDQAYGAQARQMMLELVGGKSVTVKVRGQDPYGRLLAQVSLVKIDVVDVLRGEQTVERRVKTSIDLSEALVKAGLAWWYREHAAKDRRLAALEDDARQARRGLWAEANPAPPWEWRQTKREPSGATGDVDLSCQRDSDCVFLPPICSSCAPCTPTWRPVGNRSALERIRGQKARARCAPAPQCPSCSREENWLRGQLVCTKRRCTIAPAAGTGPLKE